MFDQDPPFLKIFAGVGKVTVVTKEAVVAGGDFIKMWKMWISSTVNGLKLGYPLVN